MIFNNQKNSRYYFFPIIIFLLAVSYLACLLLTIREEVFFSGDGGIKFLMVRQIARGGNYVSLDLRPPGWATNIWKQGFYPLKIPFVYNSPRGKIVSFPPAFQTLNAYLYKWFGFYGIYVIPSLSLVTLWAWIIDVLRKMGTSPLIVTIGTCFIVFASPLTFYGAVYWEHSLSVLLIFSAIAFLINPPESIFYAALLGGLSGASIWIRPEMLLLCLLVILLVLLNYVKQRKRTDLFFMIACLPGLILFFAFNYIEYHDILGAHSYQLFNILNTRDYFTWKFTFLMHLNARLIIYFPVILFIFIMAVYALLKKIQLPSIFYRLLLTVILFLLLMPFALPNAGGKQWGPRYFLPVVPFIIIILCLVIKRLNRKMIWALPVFFVYSVYINVYLEYKTLKNDYAFRVRPGLEFLKSDSCKVIVVQNQFITQEFAVLLEEKQIFLAEDQASFSRLQQLLKAANVLKIIYVSHDFHYEMEPDNLLTNNRQLKQIGDYQFAEYELK